tara:strand:+ start:2174 stop:2344 length:171 start_codon:yes stop_codon:yes gene_type:complete
MEFDLALSIFALVVSLAALACNVWVYLKLESSVEFDLALSIFVLIVSLNVWVCLKG